jgi:hypothetical protein
VPGLGVREKCSNRRPRVVLFLPSEPPTGVGSDIDWAMRCGWAWCGTGACIVMEGCGGLGVMMGGLYAYDEEFTEGA